MMRSARIQFRSATNPRELSRALGLLVLAVGVLVLTAWVVDNVLLTRLLTPMVAMKANAALGFVLSGAVLTVRERERSSSLARGLAWCVFVIGAATLVEWSTSWDLGIDQALVRDASFVRGAGAPGRMAPATALCLGAIGAGLLLGDRPSQMRGRALHALALLVGLIALLSLVGYVYGVGPTFGLAAYTTHMAVHTALGLALLSVSLQLRHPEHGIVGLSSQGSAARLLLGRSLPLAIVLPVAIGWLCLQGQHVGLYGSELGQALNAASNVVVFSLLVVWSARAVHGLDTARASAVDALRAANQQLDERVNARTAELSLANTALRGLVEQHEQAQTELRRSEAALRESTALWRAILDSANVSIISSSPEGLIREFNPAAERLLGYTAADMIGKHSPLMLHDAAQVAARAAALSVELGRPIEPGFEAFVAKARAGTADEHEWTYVRKDGRRVPVMLSVTVMRGGADAEVGFLGIASDLTERKRAERALMQAIEVAETATRARSDFLARMSHEIRTPLNGVLGMLDLASHTELDVEQREYMETARSSALTLLEVIGDILDFSKIDAGKLRLECTAFGLQACLGTALQVLAKRAHDKRLELLLDLPPDIPDRLLGDPQRLRQIVINLVSNAIKFTDQGEIKLTVALLASSATAVTLSFKVTDRGIGVAVEKQAEIFEAFAQVDDSIARRFGGTGLGLSICAQLVALMGGKIGVDSAPGAGSTFWFELVFPLDAHDAAMLDVEPLPRGMRVLIADDHAENRRILTGLLEAWHMSPVAVPGAEALAALRETGDRLGLFSMVLIDDETATKQAGLLDELAGYVARGGRAIVLAHVSSPAQSALTRLSAARLPKPVQPSTLLETMRGLLDSSRARPASLPPARQPQPRDRRALRVLVAEDAPINQRIACALLARAGHSSGTAGDGRAALEALGRERYDLVLMDVQMPLMDGLEATRAVRASEQAWARIPIIALTAQAMQGDRQRCLEAGMDGYITKPFDFTTLRTEIDRVMEQHASAPAAPAPSEAASGGSGTGAAQACFDRGELMHRLGGSEDLFEEVASLFARDAVPLFDQLRAAIDREDRTAAAACAHRLLGSVLAVSAKPTATTTEVIEQCVRAGELRDVGAPLARLAIQLAELNSALLSQRGRHA